MTTQSSSQKILRVLQFVSFFAVSLPFAIAAENGFLGKYVVIWPLLSGAVLVIFCFPPLYFYLDRKTFHTFKVAYVACILMIVLSLSIAVLAIQKGD